MRVFCKMAAAMLCVLLIAGCAQPPANVPDTADGAQQPGASVKDGEAAAAQDDKGPVLKWLSVYYSYDPNSEYVAKMLEERTGYRVEYNLLPAENANERLSLEISSGTTYDVLKINAEQYSMLAGQGALLALDPYLETYPDIVNNTDPHGWLKVKESDGKTYGVPEVGLVNLSSALGYRGDIFEKNNWKEPTTLDEFYQLLKDIKETTGLIPITGNQPYFETVGSAFGLDSYSLTVVDGKVQSRLRLPGMKEYLAYMNKLYSEGLIDIDWPVNKGENINQKMSTGAAVMANMNWTDTPGWTRALRETVPEAQFHSILPLKDSTGKQHINTSQAVSLVMCIPKTAEKNAKYTMGMINSRLQKDTWWAFNAGEEGVHYNLEDGRPVPIQPKYKDDMTNGNYFQTSVHYPEHAVTWQARVAKDELLYEAWHEMNLKSIDIPYTFNEFGYASFPEYDKYNAALVQKCNDYFIKVIVGTESVDSFDAFVKSWEADGGLEYESGAQAWYDANPDTVRLTLDNQNAYYDIFKR